jgi:hypothetical protein
MEKLEPSCTVTVGNDLLFPQKVKQQVVKGPINLAFRYISNRTENICSHRHQYMNAQITLLLLATK